MELTSDILIKNGFKTNHPEKVLHNYYYHGINPNYRIGVDTVYASTSDKIVYVVNCTKCNDKGVIIKTASVDSIDTVEDLQKIIDLCDINKLIYV